MRHPLVPRPGPDRARRLIRDQGQIGEFPHGFTENSSFPIKNVANALFSLFKKGLFLIKMRNIALYRVVVIKSQRLIIMLAGN